MTCCGCGTSVSKNGVIGVLIKKVVTKPGPKSGTPVPYSEPFNNGKIEKFVCNDCLLATDAAHLLGEYDQRDDIPDEEIINERDIVPSMFTTLQRWGRV